MEKENKKPLEILGHAYLRVPRSILNGMFNEEKFVRQRSLLYCALLALCYHTDGKRQLETRKVTCNAGELITNSRELSRFTWVPATTVRRILNLLEKEELIRRKYINYHYQLIQVNGYLDITRNFIRSESSPKVPYSPPAASPPGTNTSGIDQEEMKRRIQRIHNTMAG